MCPWPELGVKAETRETGYLEVAHGRKLQARPKQSELPTMLLKPKLSLTGSNKLEPGWKQE